MEKTNQKLNIKEFIWQYKLSLICTNLFTLLLYGIKLIHYSISIDTEIIINSYSSMMTSWLSIQRFTLVFLKYILHLNPFKYYLANSLMIIFFSISTYFLYYIIYKNSNDQPNNLKILLFTTLVISSPIFAEQFNFTLQCAEVAISLFIFDIGLSLYFKYINKNNILLLISSILCFTLCLGTYQTFMTILISLLIFYLLINYKPNHPNKNIKKYIITSFVVIITSFLLYNLISKIVMHTFKLTSSSYLTNQISWLSKPITYNIIILIKYITKVFLGYGTFYSLSYFLSFIIISNNIQQYKQDKFYILINILCLLSPFLLSILLGTPEATRAQMTLPLLTPLIITFLNNLKYKKTITTITIIIMISQTITTITLLYNNDINYQKDKKLAENIMKEIEPNLENHKLVLVGHTTPKNNFIKGDSLGASFFNWDTNTPYGTNARAIGFMNTLGYHLEYPTIEEYELAKTIAKEQNLTTYPDKNSIYSHQNLIIIKLSN